MAWKRRYRRSRSPARKGGYWKRRRSVKGRMYGGAFPKKRATPPGKWLGVDECIAQGNGIAYSDDNMRKICENEVNILSYRDLMNCNSLHQVLGEHGAAIILYETEPQYGHWVSLLCNEPGVVEFFDSYGKPPDSQLQYVPESMHCEPVLKEMCAQAGARLIWNDVKLQSEASDKSTCGRWASLRIAMRFMTMEQFQHFFLNQKLPPDSYVTAFTMFIR
jgi:hypothetical protein